MSISTSRAEVSIQAVILVPVVLLVVAICFHIGALLHQGHIAQLAASRGAQVASGMSLSAEASHQARQEVQRVVNDLGSRLDSSPRVTYRNQGVEVTVKIRASAALSFLPSTASAQVWRPLETFRIEHERQ